MTPNKNKHTIDLFYYINKFFCAFVIGPCASSSPRPISIIIFMVSFLMRFPL